MTEYKTIIKSRFLRFVVLRLLLTIVVAFFVAAIVFFAIHLVPGDPAMNLLGTNSTAVQRAQLREVMGLDKPVLIQFFIWMSHLVRGDLGYSYSQGIPVLTAIATALKNTIYLGLLASAIALVLGLVMGNLATSNSRVVRRTIDWIEAIFLSAPQYSVALVLMIAFAVLIPVFPSGGTGVTSALGSGAPQLSSFVLPSVALALAPGAQVGRSLKTSISALQSTEMIPALEARGLSSLRLSAHVHQNALPPMITVLGIQVGGMLGGALFVESIFSIPGLGKLLVQSVTLRDYQLVEGVALTIAFIFIFVLLIADIVNALIDPRVRNGRL